MAIKLSVKRNKTVDAPNAYTVTVTSDEPTFGCKLEYEVHTSERGEGLWIDGKQCEGTTQFHAGKQPREAIRRYFLTQ